MPGRREEAIRQALRVERDVLALEGRTLAELRRELEEVKNATLLRLSAARADWDIHQAQVILAEIERQMRVWEVSATQRITSAMQQADVLGRAQVIAALKAGGVEISVAPAISSAMLSVSIQTLPVLITGVSRETIRRIGGILRSTVLAQQTPFAAMQEIARFIPPTGNPGPFGAAFRRAEAIVRSEVGRIAQTANHATLAELDRRDGGYSKEWIAHLDSHTRPTHIAANGQRVKVSEPFRVGGSLLLYPHDPRGNPAQTVNCRCVSVPVRDDWRRLPFGRTRRA